MCSHFLPVSIFSALCLVNKLTPWRNIGAMNVQNAWSLALEMDTLLSVHFIVVLWKLIKWKRRNFLADRTCISIP
jgi:hypothetical protein